MSRGSIVAIVGRWELAREGHWERKKGSRTDSLFARRGGEAGGEQRREVKVEVEVEVEVG